METKENGVELSNRLIAEFMGYDYHKGLFIHRDAETPIGNTIKPDELQYHPSCDWLMQVVEKIESVHECSYKVTLQYAIGFIFDNSKHSSPCIVRGIGMTRIETAYNLVINFIKWYNTQTTTP